MIRKLRTCPAATSPWAAGRGLAALPGLMTSWEVFHFAPSADSEERSSGAFGGTGGGCGRAGAGSGAGGYDAFAELHARGVGGAVEVDDAAGDGVADDVLEEEIVEAGGDHLLDGKPQLALDGVDFEHLRLDALADAEDVGGVVEALSRQ